MKTQTIIQCAWCCRFQQILQFAPHLPEHISWSREILIDGTRGKTQVSHGICEDCAKKQVEDGQVEDLGSPQAIVNKAIV